MSNDGKYYTIHLTNSFQTVLVLKYIVPEIEWPMLWLGVANPVANGMIMLRFVLLQYLPS